MKAKIKLYDGIMPKRAYYGDAGFDVFMPRDTVLRRGRQMIDLGFALELPRGYAATIQPRSGFSVKGMEVMDKRGSGELVRIDADIIRGLVDEGYRGHVGVIVKVFEKDASCYILQKGTRIAQMQIVAVPEMELEEVDALDMSYDRGGGFGHSGTK